MKRKLLIAIMVALMACMMSSCSGITDTGLPEKHTIPYDKSMSTLNDDEGADAFGGKLDAKSDDDEYYKIDDYYNMESDDDLHIISHFKTYQQTTEYTCGCASTLMVIYNIYNIKKYNEMEIAKMADSNDETGTSVEGVCKALDEIGLKYEYHASTDYKFHTYEEVEDYFINCVDKKRPVMVDWEDWGGHWQCVIGVDTCGTKSVYDDVLILADPYDITDHYQDGYYTYPLARFISMWTEGTCADKTHPYVQPYVTVTGKK